MTETINGSCLCGNVEFEVENEFEDLFFCHCEQCRKMTGSAFASNLFCRLGKFNWVRGEEDIKRFDVPNRQISNSFCRECGSDVPYVSSSGVRMVVPAGTLNSEPNFARQSKIFYTEQTQWCQTDDKTGTFDGFPEE